MRLIRVLRVIAVLGAYGALAAALYKRAQAAGVVGGTPATSPTAAPRPVVTPVADSVGPVDAELIGV